MAHRQPRNPVTAGSESELRRNPHRDPQGSSSTSSPLIPSTVRLLSEENKKRIQEWETERKKERKSTELYRARHTADKTEMYQLLGFYSVFQGVVFNTVATSTKLTCQTSWLPAVLSLLIFVSITTSVHYKLTDYESDMLRLVNSQNIEQVRSLRFTCGKLILLCKYNPQLFLFSNGVCVSYCTIVGMNFMRVVKMDVLKD